MYHPEYLARRAKIKELVCILNVARSAVFVITFRGYSIKSPPTVSHTRIGYSFYGHTSITMRDYVTVCYTGILLRVTKRIVLITF